MAGQIWFGTRGREQWVPAPAVNVGASKVGWQTQMNYLNGGALVRRSVASHKEFNLSWSLTTRERIRRVTDYADGVYGQGPIYWLDPFVADTNLLPAYWAAPFMAAYDGPRLVTPNGSITAEETDDNNLGYPAESAVITVGTGAQPEVYIPLPPNYTAWVGAAGVAGGGTAGVQVLEAHGPTATDNATTLTLLGVNDSTRFNHMVDGSDGATGIVIRFTGSGTFTLSGMIVQVLPDGRNPEQGGFISGQGHSGARFQSQPQLTQYNAVLDRVGLSATLVETEAWL